MGVAQKFLLHTANRILTEQGFVAQVMDGKVLVRISSSDTDKVLSVYDGGGIDAVDEKILSYGRKLETKIIANLADCGYEFQCDGFKVDKDNRAIYIMLSPTKSATNTISDNQVSKDINGDDLMKEQIHPGMTPVAKKKIRDYRLAEYKFKRAFIHRLSVAEALNVSHDILAKANKLTDEFKAELTQLREKVATLKNEDAKALGGRLKNVVSSVILALRDMPVDEAIDTMNEVVDFYNKPAEPKPPAESPKKSIDAKIDAARKQSAVEKQGKVKGYDPVTDIYTGKDEGPLPTFNTNELKKPPANLKTELSFEKPEKETLKDIPTLSQEEYKKKSALAHEIVMKSIAAGLYPQSQESEEFAKLMDMSNEQLNHMANVIATVNPDTSFVQEGQLVDLNQMFGG